MAADNSSPEFLTTREVAALLRVRERKVYEMAAADAIPCRRVTGKLLFPRADIEAWLAGPQSPPVQTATQSTAQPSVHQAQQSASRPNVLAGSHDPLLDWALREAETGLATFFDGSLDGLERFSAGEAIACGMHIFEPGTDQAIDVGDGNWNVGHAGGAKGEAIVLLEWARRRQGLILGADAGRSIGAVGDLRGHRIALRQKTAGSRILFDHLLSQSGLAHDDLEIVPATARTETDAATLVASGQADASLGLESAARQFKLGFVPLVEERYDLLVDRRCYFEPPLQKLFAFCRSADFSRQAKEMGGYNLSGHGRVHLNGP